jgi:hypothetical protein
MAPTTFPTKGPTKSPSASPTHLLTSLPTVGPTDGPSIFPTALPTAWSTRFPSENEQIISIGKGLEHDSKKVESLENPSTVTSETSRSPLLDTWIQVAEKTTWFDYFLGT